MPTTPVASMRRVLHAVGSLWFAAALLVLLPVAMAYATVFESAHGAEQALAMFYRSWWFETLLVLLAINVTAAVVVRFPISRRQVGFVITHTAILVTCGGALLSKFVGLDGQVGIAEGESIDQFSVSRATLLVGQRDCDPLTLDLSGAIGTGFRQAEFANPPTLAFENERLEVIQYLPDSESVRRVTDDNPRPQPAIEVSLAPGHGHEPTLITSGQTVQIDGHDVTYRRLADARELARLVTAVDTSGPASIGTVRIEYEGQTYEVPVEDCSDAEAPLGDTGLAVRVLRYLPHAMVGANGQITSASTRPQNPFIEVEIRGPDGSETRRAFAKFPRFESMHGAGTLEGLSLTFVVTESDRPAAEIEVLSGPDEALFVRFAHEGGSGTAAALKLGAAIPTPHAEEFLTVERIYRNARVTWSLEPVAPAREQRTPAIQVRMVSANGTYEQWLQRGRPTNVMIEGGPRQNLFGEAPIALGFDVRLEKFTVGYYPGTQRPRTFESRVTIIDPRKNYEQTHTVSMNHPLKYGGFTFYQSSYRQDGGVTMSFLSVSRDPGTAVVFGGYIALMAGMIIVFATRLAEHWKFQRLVAANAVERRAKGDRVPAPREPSGESRPRRDPLPVLQTQTRT